MPQRVHVITTHLCHNLLKQNNSWTRPNVNLKTVAQIVRRFLAATLTYKLVAMPTLEMQQNIVFVHQPTRDPSNCLK